jgi:predicted ArsR family transcriptional regulator
MDKDIIDFETRKSIYNYILENPGLHEREISRKMDIPKTTMRYHLSFLQKQKLIESDSSKRFIRYYVTTKYDDEDNSKIINYLRQKTTREIILMLLLTSGSTMLDLGQSLQKAPPTIAFYLKRLEKDGIIKKAPISDGIVKTTLGAVERSPKGREILYRVDDSELLYKLFFKYKESLLTNEEELVLEEVSDLIVDNLEKMMEGKAPKKFKTIDKTIDTLLESGWEIFPHPYHV